MTSLVPHAGVLSAPNTPAGPADSSCIFAPQGHPFEARRAVVRLGNSADRARLYGGGESADLHPGLVSLPGSQSVLDPGRRFNRSGLTSAGEPCRRALSPDGRGGISLHLFRCSGKHAAQHLTESFGSVAPSIIGSLHGSNLGASHAREAVNLCQEPGNVCRA